MLQKPVLIPCYSRESTSLPTQGPIRFSLPGAIHRLWDYPSQGGWQTLSSEPRNLASAFTNPNFVLRTSELGGAIPFAWDPGICNVLDPDGFNLWGLKFSSCGDVGVAIRAAFESWSSNHPRIKFMDVTNDCVALASAGAPGYHNMSESQPCPLARVWLTTTAAATRDHAAAITTTEYSYNMNFRHTSGRFGQNGAYVAVHSTIGLRRNGICWYTDAVRATAPP